MAYALKTAEAKFLMTVPSSMGVAAAAAKNAGIPKEHVFLLEGEMEGFTTMKQLLEMGKSFGKQGQIESFKLPQGKKNKDVCGFLSFSSGTTGLPKAVGTHPFEATIRADSLTESQVMIAHQNVIAQCLQVRQITPPDLEKILAVLPLFHSEPSIPS